MKIFFDLDGTLIDSKLRLYKLFQELVPKSNLTFIEYWNFKQNKINHAKILKEKFDFDESSIFKFKQDWMKLIEIDRFLKLDTPIDGVGKYLLTLKEKEIDLFVVTARQNKSKAVKQIEDFGLLGFFNQILVTENKKSKFDLIHAVLQGSSNGWMIGDTGYDIQVGKKLFLNTAAVLTGFLNERVLLDYNPDLILDKITNFKV